MFANNVKRNQFLSFEIEINLIKVQNCLFDPTLTTFYIFIFMQVAEWQGRAEKFEEMCCSVIQMFARLSNSANRTILYDLYPYIWDIKSIISMVKSFVQWLGTYDWDRNMLTLCEHWQ